MPALKTREKSLGIVGTRRCPKCGSLMHIKPSAEKKLSPTLPCTATCTGCGDWFDCRQPLHITNRKKG